MQNEISTVDDGSELDAKTRARLTEFLVRYEAGLTEEDHEAVPSYQFARDVQDQIHDQLRKF